MKTTTVQKTSPLAIKTMGGILWENAMDQVAAEQSVTTDDLKELMEGNAELRGKVRGYVLSAFNFAMSRVPS